MRERTRNFVRQRQSREFQLRKKNNFREPHRQTEKCCSPCPPRGCSKTLFLKPPPNPSDTTSAPHWSRWVPQRRQRPCSPRLCLCGHQGGLLGQPGAAGQSCAVPSEEKCCPRVCKVVAACAQQGRRWRGAESTCRGARSEGGRRRSRTWLEGHLRETGQGWKPVPGPASGLASAPCGQSVLTRKEMAIKAEGFSVWMQCVPTDSFTRTHFTLGAFSVICTHRKLM